MLRLVAAFALLATARSLTCITGTGEANMGGPSCDGTTTVDGKVEELTDICLYVFEDKSQGCLPKIYTSYLSDTSEAGCNDGACWCLTDDCNTQEWAVEFKKTYVPPDQCYSGLAGSNEGPTCEKSQVYKDAEYKTPNCWARMYSNKCQENNEWLGDGDCSSKSDQSSCESGDQTRDADKSYDGTDKYCIWFSEKTKDQKNASCQVDDDCTWYADRGENINGEMQGNCEWSDSAHTKNKNWQAQRGKDCDARTKSGCFENNDHMGEAERCSKHTEQTACFAQVDDCWEGTCSGNYSGGDPAAMPCDKRTSDGDCSSTPGCSWTKQCCQWIPEPTNLADTCVNSGAGTLAGVCEFNDGNGPPSKDIIGAGFEHGLFQKMDRFQGQCGLVASFRVGKGAAVALGSDKVDLVGTNCQASQRWKSIAEHVGHTSETIDEYCQNFIPDATALSAISQYSPSYIISKAKQGQFGEVMTGLKDLMFIVTSKPEYGECLFFAHTGTFGAGVCTCDKKECNGKDALELIVDGDAGPMRLLQFIDGSLCDLKDKMNGIVSGLMGADCKIDKANVGKVTEAHVDDIMKLEGVSDKTNKEELWGIVQDFQAMVQAEADFKSGVTPAVAPGGGGFMPAVLTQAAAEETLIVTTIITGLDFDKVEANANLKTTITATMKTKFATANGVAESQVEVVLSKGSVKVEARIVATAGQTVSSKVPTAAEITTAVKAIPDIDTVKQAGVEIAAGEPDTFKVAKASTSPMKVAPTVGEPADAATADSSEGITSKAISALAMSRLTSAAISVAVLVGSSA